MTAPAADSSASPGASRGFLRLVYINAFVTGSVVMGFEMLGSRYLNPFFGSGIYIWAALISTVLASLTAGYFFGGWMADRNPSPQGLGTLIVLGAVYMAAIPFAAPPAIEAISDASEALFGQAGSERYGSILGALALLFVPLALLGVYSPYAIRLTLRSTQTSGFTAGRIYGISTLGSIFGTLFVTFYLIPAMGSRSITYMLAAITFASGLSFFVAAPRRVAGLATAAALFALTLPADAARADERDKKFVDHKADPYTPTVVLERIETEYNNIFIVARGDFVSMTFRLKGENSTQSTINKRVPEELPLAHSHYQTLAGLYADRLDSMLMVGLGGGSVTDYFLRHVPEMKIVSVEIDKGVVDAAKKYFGVKEDARHRIVIRDGRVHMQRDRAKYDVIMIDAFRGGYVPFHLLTHEFYALLVQRLNPGGVAVLNLRAGTELFASSINTLARHFKFLEVYEVSGNAIVLARVEPAMAPAALQARLAEREAKYKFRYRMAPMLRDKSELRRTDARVLTDDFAPVNQYDAIERKTQK